jgi:hypothetical protein
LELREEKRTFVKVGGGKVDFFLSVMFDDPFLMSAVPYVICPPVLLGPRACIPAHVRTHRPIPYHKHLLTVRLASTLFPSLRLPPRLPPRAGRTAHTELRGNVDSVIFTPHPLRPLHAATGRSAQAQEPAIYYGAQEPSIDYGAQEPLPRSVAPLLPFEPFFC